MVKGGEIGQEIKCLSNEIRRCMLGRDDKRGITRMQGLIIGYIHHEGENRDIFQRDIETQFNIRRSTVAEMLKLMEKNGLIERTNVKEDARLKKITLTPKAEQIHEMVHADIEMIEMQLRRGIPEKELVQFLETTRKMRKNLIDMAEAREKELRAER